MFDPVKSPPFQSTTSFSLNTPSPHPTQRIGSYARSAPYTDGSAATTSNNNNANARPKFTTENTVGLSCVSPDGGSIHSLCPNGTVVTHFLPLHEADANTDNTNANEEEPSNAYTYTDQEDSNRALSRNDDEAQRITSVTTKLPSHMIQSLEVDSPMEIICVDNDTTSSTTKKSADGRNARNINSLPLLCIYTAHSAYVLKIQYDTDTTMGKEAVGQIAYLHEPFESHLTSHSTSSVIKIRSAPHSHLHDGNTYSALCPRGAMLLLTSQSSVVLFHGYHDAATDGILVPIAHGHDTSRMVGPALIPSEVTIATTIDPEETDMTPFVDFIFLPSSPATNAQCIWNSMAVILVTESGGLYALSPIVFHNAVFSTRYVQEAKEVLEMVLVKYEHSVGRVAECRRAKAALQFFKDAFGELKLGSGARMGRAAGSGYVKANILEHVQRGTGTRWPVALQRIDDGTGDPAEDGGSLVNCMEVVLPPSVVVGSTTGSIAGIILARGSNIVEYKMIPCGEHILPRFGFENMHREDVESLNALIADSTILAEKIVLGQEEAGDRGCMTLLLDPVDKSMVHHISKKGVMTITTNAIPSIESKLNAISTGSSVGVQDSADDIKTNAWTSVSIAEGVGKELNGVAISGDVQFGHVLVVVLSDGTTEAMNMTAAMYLNEARNQIESEVSNTSEIKDGSKESNEIQSAMESIPPLHELIKPQIEKISNGLSNMTKVVGGSTDPREITPGILATFLSTKQSSEQDIILPLKEMNSLVVSRVKYLRSMKDNQREQLEELKATVQLLQDRMKATSEKMALVQSNTKVLSNRSASILETARDLSPSITEAEHLFFKDVKRIAANCDKWDGAIEDIKGQCASLRVDASATSTSSNTTLTNLTPEQKQMCDTLLEGQNEILKGVKSRVRIMEYKRDKILVACGLEEERKPLNAISDCRANH